MLGGSVCPPLTLLPYYEEGETIPLISSRSFYDLGYAKWSVWKGDVYLPHEQKEGRKM